MSRQTSGLKQARRNAERNIRSTSHRKKKRKKWPIILVIILAVIALSVGGAFVYINEVSRKQLLQNDNIEINLENVDGAEADGDTITYNGKKYLFNKNLVTVLMLGVDKMELGSGEAVGQAGQADTIALVVYDTETGESTILVVPRDTIADVNVYDTEGGYYKILKQQICLSYAYGDGGESSCSNTITSVKRLLLGIPVKYYLSLDRDGIVALNDFVGGIEVRCLHTIGPFVEDEVVTLKGKDVDAYVRDRSHEDVDADSYRRERQRQYIKAYADKALHMAREDFSFVYKWYKTASPYISTNLDVDEVAYLASTALTKTINLSDFRTIPGSYKMGETYAEYYVNTDSLFEMILDVFYNEKAGD